MIVFITGATGFIGSRLAEWHLKLGNNVRYLTRGNSKPIHNAEPVLGDLQSICEHLTHSLNDVNVMYSCAGEVEQEAYMYATHVQGTVNLLNIIKKSRLHNQTDFHWIQLSSCGAYGQTDSQKSVMRHIDEMSPNDPSGEYECTKTEADNLIIAFAKKHDWFKYTIIRPTIVFGEGMRSTLIIRIASLIKKRLFFYIGNKDAVANFVHINDVVQAMTLSTNHTNAYNQIFIVSNDCKLSALVDSTATALRAPKPCLVINESFLRKSIDVISKCIKLPISNAQLDVLVRKTHYSNDKIRKSIGWVPSASVPVQLKQYVSIVFNIKNG